ncbi:MAG: hypothetical protein WCI11_12290 [Candidatus Methylumidiphilus sp.]
MLSQFLPHPFQGVAALRTAFSAAITRVSVSASSILRSRHCVADALNLISTVSAQLLRLGV